MGTSVLALGRPWVPQSELLQYYYTGLVIETFLHKYVVTDKSTFHLGLLLSEYVKR